MSATGNLYSAALSLQDFLVPSMSKLQMNSEILWLQICSPPEKLAALEVGVLAPVVNLALAELSSGRNLICSNLLVT